MPAPAAPVDALTGIEAARFGIYVHFPYCLSKCPYCDFASTAAKEVPEARYAKAVRRELTLALERWPALRRRRAQSLYLGGGTPSLWGVGHVAGVVEALAAEVGLEAGAEVTLEANPGAADASRFRGYKEAGVNRLSIGVQSFQPETLRALGREHDGPAAERAYAAARAAGFDNVSLDLIYGVHGQAPEQVEADAARAAALGPEHLSAYALTLDKEALAEEVPLAKQLARGEVRLPEEDVVVRMGRAAAERFAERGIERYEISNYARPGFHSRHNALYWTGGEYLALGVGATGTVGGERYSNDRSAERYLRRVEAGERPVASAEALGRRELFEERLAMGLRLCAGVDLQETCRAYGEPFEPRAEKAARYQARGLARWDGRRLALTDEGADLHSAVSADLF
ncbi:MAG TPA: radical SAM family heme chaperone HemW [Myxococcaceae bacterium]|nr:radical SAM family heme chaperone HemW [Myxococcaceae bacterium]